MAAVLGGAVVGGALGAGVLVGTDLSDALGDSAVVVPAVGSAVVAGAAGLSAGRDDFVGTAARAVFAKPITSIGDAAVGGVKRKIRNAFQAVVGFPGYVANGIKQKITQTVDDIVALPGRTATKVKEEVTAIPGKVKTSVSNKAKEVETNIKAIPSNVAKAAVRSAASAVRSAA